MPIPGLCFEGRAMARSWFVKVCDVSAFALAVGQLICCKYVVLRRSWFEQVGVGFG
jgi:hypothetical protein